jgi:hypothetical protein
VVNKEVVMRVVKLIALGMLLLVPQLVLAQDAGGLELFIRRNVGYSGGGEIQGSFRAEATGPDDLVTVTFKIDGEVLGTDAEAPFRVDFNTDDYATGLHTFTAEGETTSGQTLISNERQFEFVTAEESWRAAGEIMIPIFSVLGFVLLVGVGLSLLQIRQSKKNPTPLGAQRRYGLMGGTICPKCGRPFARHWWGLNAGLGKYDRCDHCGKWSVVRALPLEQLRAAEAAELKLSGPGVAEMSAEERLRRQLEESRYTE